MTSKCPTCGSQVEVVTGEEGTSYFVPKDWSKLSEIAPPEEWLEMRRNYENLLALYNSELEIQTVFPTALMLVAEGDYVLLKMEVVKGEWITLIKERLDSPFSHIIEPNGISQAIRAYILQEIDNALKNKEDK